MIAPQLYYFCIRKKKNKTGFSKLYELFGSGVFKDQHCKEFYRKHYEHIIRTKWEV